MAVSRLDPAATALVLVDLQRGVVALPVAPHPADEVVANATRLARAFRAAGAPVILVRVSFSADGADALTTLVDESPRAASGRRGSTRSSRVCGSQATSS